jgi:hypothetical protein
MSSALVGSWYGWDGGCGSLGGGGFGCVVGWVWRVCEWRAMSDSGESLWDPSLRELHTHTPSTPNQQHNQTHHPPNYHNHHPNHINYQRAYSTYPTPISQNHSVITTPNTLSHYGASGCWCPHSIKRRPHILHPAPFLFLFSRGMQTRSFWSNWPPFLYCAKARRPGGPQAPSLATPWVHNKSLVVFLLSNDCMLHQNWLKPNCKLKILMAKV